MCTNPPTDPTQNTRLLALQGVIQGVCCPTMTSTPSKPKSTTPDQDEGTVDRLLNEVRSLHRQLADVRHEVSKADVDFDRMSVLGGIKKLANDRLDAYDKIRALEKELNKMVKQSR